MSDTEQDSKPVTRRVHTGTVTAIGGESTIRVIINSSVKHPRYGKYVNRRTRLAVHDSANAAKKGDVVEIAPCRPISKTKSWRLVRVVRTSALLD